MRLLLDTNAYAALFRGHNGVDDFLASPYVFGRIAAALRRKGRPLPTNDIWIAAHAMECGADLLSFDRHFAEVDGIAWLHPEGSE